MPRRVINRVYASIAVRSGSLGLIFFLYKKNKQKKKKKRKAPRNGYAYQSAIHLWANAHGKHRIQKGYEGNARLTKHTYIQEHKYTYTSHIRASAEQAALYDKYIQPNMRSHTYGK